MAVEDEDDIGEEERIIKLFQAFDTDSNGTISKEDMFTVLTELGMTSSEVEEIFEIADKNQDTTLDIKEFTHWIFSSASTSKLFLDKCQYAPYLMECYKIVCDDANQLTASMAEFLMNPEGQEAEGEALLESQDARYKAVKKKMWPLIEQSFSNHDTDGSGCLSREEAMVFFSNVVAEQGSFAEMAMAITEQRAMKMMLSFFLDMDDEQKHHAKKNVDGKIVDMKRDVAGKVFDYKHNKKARDAAAFQVLDDDGNGKLDFDNFAQALMPGEDRNREFLAALGIEVVDVMMGG